jgi:sec-independent protein translocase protein TatA
MQTLAVFGIGLQEMVLIAVVAVLIFGRRLPEVGRNLGRSLMEFKRGLKEAGEEFSDVQKTSRDISDAARQEPSEPAKPDPRA